MASDDDQDIARFTFASTYGKFASEHLTEMENCLAKVHALEKGGNLSYEQLQEAKPEIHELDDRINNASVSAVVFAGMAVEAYIYDYSARKLSKAFTDDYLDKLSLDAKWVVVPQLVTGKAFPRDKIAFSLLKTLIKARNALVHFKSRSIAPEDVTGEKIAERNEAGQNAARDAVRAIRELAIAVEALDPNEMARFHCGVS